MTKVLYICSQNKLRSPTAESAFSNYPGLKSFFSRINNDAGNIVIPELIEWADVIFVMEKSHKNKLQKKFRKCLNNKSVICLGILDEYDYMVPELVKIFETRIPKILRLI